MAAVHPPHVSTVMTALATAGTDPAALTAALAPMTAHIDATPTDEAEEHARMEFISGGVPDSLAAVLSAADPAAPLGSVAAAGNGLAELGKGKRFREALAMDAGPAVATALANVLPLVAASSPDPDPAAPADPAAAAVQLLRAVGNMTFYCDKGRQVLAEAGLAPTLVALLGLLTQPNSPIPADSRLRLVSMGAIGNYVASDDNAYVQALLNDNDSNNNDNNLYEFIFSGMTPHASPMLQTMAVRAFQALWYEDSWRTLRDRYGILDVALTLVVSGDVDSDMIFDTLATITDQAEVACQVAAATLPPPRESELLLDVLLAAAANVDEDAEDAAAAATMVIAHLALVDELVPTLLDRGVVATFCGLCALGPSAGGAQLVVRKPIMLLLGNLARSEANCMGLADAGFPAAATFNLDLIAGNDDELPLQHAILGALRNMAIAPGCRPVLRSSGILDMLLPIMASPHQPMQFNAAAIARHLTKRPPPDTLDSPDGAALAEGAALAAQALVAVPGMVAQLASLAASDALNVKMEAARTLAMLASTPESCPAVAADLADAAPYIVLLQTEYPVLHAEALDALASLAESGNAAPVTSDDALPAALAAVADADAASADQATQLQAALGL